MILAKLLKLLLVWNLKHCKRIVLWYNEEYVHPKH